MQKSRNGKLAGLNRLPAEGGDRVEAFIRKYCHFTTGPNAGQRVTLAPFQVEIIHEMYGANRSLRQGYLQMPRKNAKSTLASWLALYALVADEQQGAEVLSIGPTMAQASIVWKMCRQMVEMDYRLNEAIMSFSARLEYRALQGFMLPKTVAVVGLAGAGESRLQGFRPTWALADEVHLYPSRDGWDALLAGQASVSRPFLLGTSTPGASEVSAAYEIYEQATTGVVPNFSSWIWEAPPGCDVDDVDAWIAANPGLIHEGNPDGWIAMEHVRAERATMPEHKFRRYRLGQWAATPESFLPVGSWGDLARPGHTVEPGTKIYAMFDGSFSGDSTAIVACTEDMHLFVVDCWEKPPGILNWRVPRDDVNSAIETMMETYNVRVFWADPPYWQREIADWATKYGRKKVLEWPTYVRSRMAPACTNFIAAVLEKRLTHDGDPRLAQHISNTVTKATSQGDVVTTVTPNSPKHIDLAVAAIGAVQAATQGRGGAPKVW